MEMEPGLELTRRAMLLAGISRSPHIETDLEILETASEDTHRLQVFRLRYREVMLVRRQIDEIPGMSWP